MKRFIKSLAWLFTWFSAISGGFSVSGVTPIAAPGVLPRPPSTALLPITHKHNTALVAALDGTIYLVDSSSRKVLWSFESGESIYSSYQALPDHDGGDIDASEQRDFYIDCGDDWGLYVHGPGYEGAKLSVGPEEFIRRTPIISADGGVMIGSKNTTVFLVDAKSGRVIHAFNSDHSVIGSGSADEKTILPKKDIEDLMASRPLGFEEVDQPLYVFRTDYALKYFSQKTGKDLWRLKFAEIKASFQCLDAGNHFGEFFSNTENGFDPPLNGDGQFPYDCQRTVDVFRIRDHSVMETLFLSDRLPNPHLDGKRDSLPAPYADSLLKPLDPLFGAYKNKEGEVMLALPPPEAKDLAIWSLPSRGAGKMYISVAPETSAWYQMYSALGGAILAAILLTPVLTFLKKSKLNKRSEDEKMLTVVPKKKKSRKSGNAKNIAAIESSKKVVASGSLVGNTIPAVESPTTESFGRKSVLNLRTPGDCGGIDGREIGKLVIKSKIIAKGSNGTVVLEGNYDGRPVAVKRLVQSHHEVALKEIQNLIASDCHPNIVRWYGVEYDQDFVYLSLERCACSLDELIILGSVSSPTHIKNQDPGFSNYTVQLDSALLSNMNLELWKANGHPSVQLLKLMTDIVSGLVHLHDLGIIHRDLKPQNVLIVKERSTLHAKLSDMGISKRLPSNMSSLTQSVTGCGSSGWQAPEQLRNGRQTRAVDLFSLGCVLFFCLTGGQHPFGDSLERDINVVNNKKDLFVIEHMPEATDLITSLLEPDPDSRPKAVDLPHHPLFWDAELRLSFLRDASDRVELEDREATSDLLTALEGIAPIALGGKWDEKMESAFINDIGKYRRYKYDSVRDLLRVIRNKLNHYRELSQEIRGILGQVPEGFDEYFSSRFPRLLIEVYKVISHFCGEEEPLRKYFRSKHN